MASSAMGKRVHEWKKHSSVLISLFCLAHNLYFGKHTDTLRRIADVHLTCGSANSQVGLSVAFICYLCAMSFGTQHWVVRVNRTTKMFHKWCHKITRFGFIEYFMRYDGPNIRDSMKKENPKISSHVFTMVRLFKVWGRDVKLQKKKIRVC